jgi:hypothetical protein
MGANARHAWTGQARRSGEAYDATACVAQTNSHRLWQGSSSHGDSESVKREASRCSPTRESDFFRGRRRSGVCFRGCALGFLGGSGTAESWWRSAAPLSGRQQQTAAVTASQNLGVRFPVSVGLIKMIKDLDYWRNIQIQILWKSIFLRNRITL